MTELIGRVIDHYRLEAMLGDGGMGTVYRAQDLNLERPVALKIMHPHYARRTEFRSRLRQEAKTLASLDHPSIVRVLDYGEDDDVAYIAMEFIRGGSLRDHLQRLQKRQRFLPLEQALQIGYQIAEALHYAHQRGLIHRDVKPSNIILKRLAQPDEPGEQPFRAVLTDFGLVKLLVGDSLTQSGTTLGTPAYMAPEQCEGLELDGRTDIYSLGVVLYELLTNHLPFTFGSLAEAIASHMRGDMPRPIHEWRPEAPTIIDAIVERALAKDPQERFLNAAALATDLRSAKFAMSDTPTQVLPVAERGRTSSRRERASTGEQPAAADESQEFRLIIATPGHDSTEVPLTESTITLGRDPDNDILLPADGVSRYHARLQQLGPGWSIVDLGGVNGTLVNDRRIQVGDATSLMVGDEVEIGPYRLTLSAVETSAPVETPVEERTTPPPQVRPHGPESPLALFLARDKVVVGPGEEAEFHLEVANRGSIDDRVTIDVEGLPEGWVQAPMEFIPLPAGESVPLTITLRPPVQTQTPAGRQRFRLRLRSQQYPDDAPAVTASLMLGALESFEATLTPQQLSVPGVLELAIRNTGNATTFFAVQAHDADNRLRFHGEQQRLRLEPQQRATIEIEVEAYDRSPFSATEAYPFSVEVRTRSGDRREFKAEADIPSLLPSWAAYSVLALVVFVCVFSALFLAFGDRQRGASATLAAQTATAIAASDLQTIVAATATIDAATRMAITPTTTADSDSDGLSDAQERTMGTAPDNPDTDGDGLLDGPEVLDHGCDPLRRDTDADFLNDWDEINVYRTGCNNPDSDGDGIPDGQEITQGTDPLVPEAATATITPLPSPTIEVTPSPTAETTETSVPTVTVTPTPTGTPSPTTTSEPTVTPSITPTATPTTAPTVTSTPTITPTPFPASACVSTTPTVDGDLSDAAWLSIAPVVVTETGRTMQVFLAKDALRLYQAFIIDDATLNEDDLVRVYFDANRNLGDPDENDRMFEVYRTGELAVFQGQGSNADGLTWQPLISDDIVAGVGSTSAAQWVVETATVTEDGLMSPSNPFSMMVEFVVDGETVTWPEGAVGGNAIDWAPIENPPCG